MSDITDVSQLLAAARRREPVDLPGLGRVWVQEMTAEEYDNYTTLGFVSAGHKLRVDLKRVRTATAHLVAWTTCYEDGRLVFPTHNGLDLVLQLPASVMAKLATVARRLSGIGLDDEDADDAARESVAEGNSAAGLAGSPNGTSPSLSAAPDGSFSPV